MCECTDPTASHWRVSECPRDQSWRGTADKNGHRLAGTGCLYAQVNDRYRDRHNDKETQRKRNKYGESSISPIRDSFLPRPVQSLSFWSIFQGLEANERVQPNSHPLRQNAEKQAQDKKVKVVSGMLTMKPSELWKMATTGFARCCKVNQVTKARAKVKAKVKPRCADVKKSRPQRELGGKETSKSEGKGKTQSKGKSKQQNTSPKGKSKERVRANANNRKTSPSQERAKARANTRKVSQMKSPAKGKHMHMETILELSTYEAHTMLRGIGGRGWIFLHV